MIRNLLDHPINLLIVVLVIVVVVGWKRLPDVARSLGRSVRILKSEVDEMKQDGKSSASGDTVKGETVHPKDDSAGVPVADPTVKPTAKSTERETHHQPPA